MRHKEEARRLLVAACIWALVRIQQTSGLSLSKKCGEHVCERYEFCSKQDFICAACSKVCEKKSHNYNERTCEDDCQDYIHDYLIEYVRKCDLERAINRIYILSVTCVVLLLLLVGAVFGVLLRYLTKHRRDILSKRLEKKKFQQKLNSVQYAVSTAANENSCNRNDGMIRSISESMTMPSTCAMTLTMSESPPLTNRTTVSGCSSTTATAVVTAAHARSSPLSEHEPCEDSTLDYAAYVNEALSPSPVVIAKA